MVGPAVLLVRKSPLVSLDQTGVGAGSAPFLGQARPGGPPGAWNAHAICPQWRSTQEGEQALGTVMPVQGSGGGALWAQAGTRVLVSSHFKVQFRQFTERYK